VDVYQVLLDGLGKVQQTAPVQDVHQEDATGEMVQDVHQDGAKRAPLTVQPVAHKPSPEPSPEPSYSVPNGTAKRPTKYGQFIDGVKNRGREYLTSPTDAKAVNQANMDPDRLAEAYVALLDGKWGDDFTRRQPLREIIPRMGAWFNRPGKQTQYRASEVI
jgi:hypothetical protein